MCFCACIGYKWHHILTWSFAPEQESFHNGNHTSRRWACSPAGPVAFCGLQDPDTELARVGMNSVELLTTVTRRLLTISGPHSRAVFPDRKIDGMNSKSYRSFKLECIAAADRVKIQAKTPNDLKHLRSAPEFVYASLCHLVPGMVQVRESEAF